MGDSGLSRAELDEAVAAALGQQSPEAFIAVDLDLRVVAWNAAAEALTGWGAADAMGRYPPHWPPPSVQRPGRPPTGVGARRHRDGSTFTVLVDREVELRSPDGRLLGHGRFLRAASDQEALLRRRNELSLALVEAVRLEEVRDTLHQAVTELLTARQAVVLAPCPGFDHLHGHLGIGTNQEEAEQVEISLSEPGPARDAAMDRRAAQGRLRVGAAAEEDCVFVPMGPVAAGWVLALVGTGHGQASPDAEVLSEAVASEAWTALRRVELVGELEGKIEILEATAAVSSSAGLDLEAVLEAVCRQAATALSCERAGVYLHAEDGTLALAHLYATDLDVAVPQGQRAAEEFLQAAEPVVIQDAGSCAFLEGPWHAHTGAVSVFGLPLRVGDRDIGVLVVAHTTVHPRGFTNLCRQVGDAVAGQAALAIENARLFANERATVAHLEALDRLKADFIDGLSHDLRSPLTGMLGFVETLRRTADSATADEREEYLAIVERQARRIAGMVDDLLTSARLEAGALTPDRPGPVAIPEIVAAVLDTLPPTHRERVSVSVGELVVEGDRSLLARAVQNLVDNALKHSPAQEDIAVVAHAEDGEVLISVSDRGPGMDEQTKVGLFSRFGGSTSQGSVGLGLYITRGIVQAHGGDVSVLTRPGEGATFTIRLPAGAGAAEGGLEPPG